MSGQARRRATVAVALALSITFVAGRGTAEASAAVVPIAPTDPTLAGHIPKVAGYFVARVPADAVLWMSLDESLPDALSRHHAVVVDFDGVPIAHLVVAGVAPGSVAGSAIDSLVEHVFASEVMLPVGASTMGDGVAVVANSAVPAWREMEGSAVIVVEQEIDGNFQWAWGADGVVWVVRGRADAEGFVRTLLRRQAPALTPYDQQGLTGDLFAHTPTLPGFLYADLPRDITLRNLAVSPLVACTEHVYFGYLTPTGVPVAALDGDDLVVSLTDLAGRCVDHGILVELAADASAAPDVHGEQIGGVAVWRGPDRIDALVGDVLITLSSGDPQTLVTMAPVVEAFFAGQPR